MTTVAVKDQEPIFPFRTRIGRWDEQLFKPENSYIIKSPAVRANFETPIARKVIEPRLDKYL